jgi:hypothetical protein
LNAVKRIFDVSELSTKNRISLVANMNVLRLNVMTFPCISAIFLAPDVGKRAYELFVEDIEAITDNSELRDVILILGDFNLPKVKRKVVEESGSMMPLNVTSDLQSDLIGGLFGCYLDQINERSNENGTFSDLVFTNVPVDMAVEGAEPPLLELDH